VSLVSFAVVLSCVIVIIAVKPIWNVAVAGCVLVRFVVGLVLLPTLASVLAASLMVRPSPNRGEVHTLYIVEVGMGILVV
jgi:hypothetical protein